jgi:hypothetical protein
VARRILYQLKHIHPLKSPFMYHTIYYALSKMQYIRR